jgi:integrase
MPLSDKEIRAAKPAAEPYQLTDERGLSILINPNGGKWWRLRYRFDGKGKMLSLGTYPDVGLKDARGRRDEARKMIANGADPSDHRKATKAAKSERSANSFEVICREWLEQRKATVEPATTKHTLARMENDVFPWLGGKAIAEITAPDVLSVMRRVDGRDARHTAHKIRTEVSAVMRYAIATGRAERDPCPDLKGAIPPAKETHFAAITDPKKVGEMLRAFDGFRGSFIVKTALLLAPLAFVRPGELRQAEWSAFDLDKAEWRYFINKTKTEHLVPLSTQAVALLREIFPLTGGGRYVFPGTRDRARPMSDGTINAALCRMGFNTKTEITGHGFRAMARTILHEELHVKPEVIEHQLAHAVSDALGTAYNRTKFLAERKAMMQIWADHLDKLKAGAEIIPMKASAA